MARVRLNNFLSVSLRTGFVLQLEFGQVGHQLVFAGKEQIYVQMYVLQMYGKYMGKFMCHPLIFGDRLQFLRICEEKNRCTQQFGD